MRKKRSFLLIGWGLIERHWVNNLESVDSLGLAKWTGLASKDASPMSKLNCLEPQASVLVAVAMFTRVGFESAAPLALTTSR